MTICYKLSFFFCCHSGIEGKKKQIDSQSSIICDQLPQLVQTGQPFKLIFLADDCSSPQTGYYSSQQAQNGYLWSYGAWTPKKYLNQKYFLITLSTI